MYFETENPSTYPVSEADARKRAFQLVGWTGRGDIPSDVLAAAGLAKPERLPRPDITDAQIAMRDTVPTLVDGEWTLGWTVRDLTTQELLDRLPWKTYLDARKAVVVWINNLTDQIETLYPKAVQKRWDEEEEAALAVKHDADEADPANHIATQRQIDMMTVEGGKKGRTPVEHAEAVIFNANRFRAIADRTNELFLETDDKLQSAASPLEYATIFAWAQQQAAPLAQEYGLTA